MITLGFSKTGFRQQGRPSPAVLQALLETAAWCSRESLRCDQLRSSELDPSNCLEVAPFEELGLRAWGNAKRESYQRAVHQINQTRSALLRGLNTAKADTTVAQSLGRLLLYEPQETVMDGAAEVCSRGFFDLEDAPPCDTWFLYSAGTIFSWVPNSLVPSVQAGIDVNPVDCIHWSQWSRLDGIEMPA